MTVAQPPPLSRSSTHGTELSGPTVSAPASPGSLAPPTAKPPSDRISTRTRRLTATAADNAPLLWTMASGPPGPLDQLPGVLTYRCESHGRGRPRPPPRTLLLPPPCHHGINFVRPRPRRASGNSSPTTSASPWRHADCIQNLMPLVTLLKCSSLISSCGIRIPTGSENSRLSRRAMPQCGTSPSAGRRSRYPTSCRATSHTSVPPFQTFWSWPVKDEYSKPPTTLSYSSGLRCRRRRLTRLAHWGARLAC